MIYTLDNFFENIDIVQEELFAQKFYTCENHPEYINNKNKWPGERTVELYDKEFTKILTNNLGRLKLDILNGALLQTYGHLRTNDSDDWVHTDNTTASGLIYINNNNLKSGTLFYNKEKEIVQDVKYVKNRLVLFSSQYPHRAYGHFGDNIYNGRVTINLFFKKL